MYQGLVNSFIMFIENKVYRKKKTSLVTHPILKEVKRRVRRLKRKRRGVAEDPALEIMN